MHVGLTVDDIPTVDLTLVVADKSTAVVLNDACQGVDSPGTAGDPARELVVPDAVVPAEELAVRLREVGNHVTIRERECPLLGLSRILDAFTSIALMSDMNRAIGILPISCCSRA